MNTKKYYPILLTFQAKNWTFTQKGCIYSGYLTKFYSLSKTMMGALRRRFTDESTEPGITRRGLLRGFGRATAVVALASIPLGSALAGSGTSSFQMRRDVRLYSENTVVQGIGAFINLQANAPVTGDQIGQWLQAQFGGITPPVPVDYRVNQSHGTTTDVTFYVRGIDFTLNIEELQARLPEILAHHRDVWLPETTAALNGTAPARN